MSRRANMTFKERLDRYHEAFLDPITTFNLFSVVEGCFRATALMVMDATPVVLSGLRKVGKFLDEAFPADSEFDPMEDEMLDNMYVY